MAKVPNPPQFEEDYDVYKMRQFVEDMIRALEETNQELSTIAAGGGTASGGGGYPAQLGYAGVR